jgi:hypothetical protein
MSGSGSGQQQQSTTQNVNQQSTRQLTPEQQQMINLAMPEFQQLATKGINLPGFPMTAGFTPTQMQGQTMALDAATGLQSPVTTSAGQGSQFMTSGDVLHPGTNPALQEYIDAATKPIQQNLTESTLPDIRMGAVGTGNMGSTREGIAEGLASGRAAQAEGLTAAQIANQGYLGGLSAETAALQSSPAVAGEQTMPAGTTSAVGDVQQQQNQAAINEQILRTMFPQELPTELGPLFTDVASALPGGTVSTTGTTTGTTTGQQSMNPGLASLLLGGGSVAAGLLGKGGLAPYLSLGA